MGLFRKKRYKQPKIDTSKKSGSFAFFLAILVYILLSALFFATLVVLSINFAISKEKIAMFCFGGIFSIGVFAGKELRSLKTLIHELKHAAVIILSGNKLTELKVAGEEGHVKYNIYSDRMHFLPFITLAPYFFPILSLPVLIACTFLEGTYELGVTILLGAALVGDLITGYQEFHPHQTDLMRVFGGLKVAKAFIIAANACWASLCLLWVFGGLGAYILTFNNFVKLATWCIEYLTQIQ